MPKTEKHDDHHLKITVVLLHRQVAALDRLAVTIRLRSGNVLSRAGIISALISASLSRPRKAVVAMFRKRIVVGRERGAQ